MPVRLHDSRIQFTPEGYLMKRLVGILSAAAITAVCSTALAQVPAAPETNSAMARDAQNPGGAPTGPRVRAGAMPETNADMARDAEPAKASETRRQESEGAEETPRRARHPARNERGHCPRRAKAISL